MTKFQAKYEELNRAVSRLVSKMDEIHESEEYRALYTVGSVHGCPYTGKNYGPEFTTVKRLVDGHRKIKQKSRGV